jgi:hypothetical protein
MEKSYLLLCENQNLSANFDILHTSVKLKILLTSLQTLKSYLLLCKLRNLGNGKILLSRSHLCEIQNLSANFEILHT